MNGAAGAGKTAITHTISEMCYRAKILAASFFFSRSIPGRNMKTFLITTIVSQLIAAIPGMREHVGNTLHQDHSLLSRTLEAQLEALIVKPLELARSQADIVYSHPKLIIFHFSFLVASRPEQKIREAFNEYTMGLLTVWLGLDDEYPPDEDIRTFLVSMFHDIKRRHPSGTSLPSWPSEEDIEQLV